VRVEDRGGGLVLIRLPSSTIRIFSSGVYLLRVALRTLRMKPCVAPVHGSACSDLVGLMLLSVTVVLPCRDSIPGRPHRPSFLLFQSRNVPHFFRRSTTSDDQLASLHESGVLA
jgi:hypothetical protein